MTPQMPQDTMQDIIDIEGIVRSPWPDLIYKSLWGLLVLAICAGLVYAVYKIYRQWQKKKAAVLLSPTQRALKSLKELESERLVESKKWSQYYHRLDEILRAYIDAEWSQAFLDQTYEQFSPKLSVLENGFSQHELQQLKDFWGRAQVVKFAKFPSDDEQSKKDFFLVRQVVQKKKPEGV